MLSENYISITDKIVAATNTLREKPSEEIQEQLISLINELINNDFHALVQLLYSVDVDENKLKELLKSHADSDSASIIADLIISRHLQKIAIRNRFADKNETFNDDDDSW
jgi:hypothetical protein